MKPSEQVPYQLDGEPCSLYKLVRKEPDWAVSRINYSVDRIAELEQQLAECREALDTAIIAKQAAEDESRVVRDRYYKELAECQRERDALRDALVSIAGGDMYPRSIAKQALEKEI